MTDLSSPTAPIRRVPCAPLVWAALIVGGLAGNYFRTPLIFGIEFLFGSIFAMLALQWCGALRG
ncbi:MAG TPA: hypothetical protein VJ001_01610, partial [Rhodocyclaceae bacterium]|nr:hypothetical protein [Rhodocyclaceae bacterium]